MLYSYLLVAIRNFSRKALYHGINILGLSVGLSVVAITTLYVVHEKNYDGFHIQSDQIVRFSSKRGDTWFGSFSPTHSRYLLDKNLSEVEKTVRLRKYPPKYIKVGQESFYEPKVLFTDTGSDFFNFFDFPAAYGNKANALKLHNSVVLTESIAKKLFGDKVAIGESIVFDTLQLTVTAVIRDLPSNTHLDFSILICNNRAMEAASAHFTYGLMSNGTNRESLKAKLMAVPTPQNKFAFVQDCKIIPLKDLHYEANMTYEMKPPGNKDYLMIFIAIGSMILLLSCINFINLSIALHSQRTKEIAVRKAIGASQRSVFGQLLIESALISAICYPFALALLELLIPPFNSLIGIRIENNFSQNPFWLAGSFLATVCIGIASSIYPSWLLPRIKTTLLFKTGFLRGVGSAGTRSVLIGFQVLIVVVMLSGSLLIDDQLEYIQEKDLGFSKEGVLKLEGAGMVDSSQFATLKARLRNHHAIVQVSHGLTPGDEDYGMTYKIEGSDEINNDLISFPVGKEYLDIMGIQLLKTDYDRTAETFGKRIVLINETFMAQLGKDCIGKSITLHPGKEYEFTRVINGIFKDFNFFSLHQPMAPMMISLTNSSSPNQNILIKVKMENQEEAEKFIKKTALETIGNIPLTLRSVDESLAKYYQNERRLLFFSRVLLGVSIILSALGFFALSSYLTELRTKEIGIRKILGASTSRLLLNLSSFFISVTTITFLLGSILSYFMLQNWLSTFAYRTSITLMPFALTLLGLTLILMVSVGFHALRTANSNPVNSLRSE